MKYVYIILFALIITITMSFSLEPVARAATGDPCVGPGNRPGTLSWTGVCIVESGEESIQAGQEVKGTCDQIKADEYIISPGFIRTLCTGGGANQTAIESIIENLTNYILNIGVIIFAIMIGLGMVQVMAGGASPESLKAGKKRIFLAASSIGLFFAGRMALDLLGITGGRFLNVDLNNFNQNTINAIIGSVWKYIQFLGGALSVAMIIAGGIRMMTAAGNPQQIQAARKTITYAVIGLLGVVSASLIFSLLGRIITG